MHVNSHPKCSEVLATMIFLTMLCNSATSELSNSGMSPKNIMSTVPVVCNSMLISNTSSLHRLKNCTVVEGFIQILRLDNMTEDDFQNISFPLLTEITDYLLISRVMGLRTLGRLFPNLAAIRGQNKMFEYSLIIYEMVNLKDIGLRNLREISSGLLRIDMNPSLCFVHSIDWYSIVIDRHGENFIKNIKSKEECPLCPSAADSTFTNVSIAQCPKGRCWNREYCQFACPPACNNFCDSKGKCCDAHCIYCLDGETHKCLVCQNGFVIMGNVCMDKCPNDTYMYLNRRCVTKSECLAMPHPLQLTTAKTMTQDKYHKVLTTTNSNGNTIRKCVLECPVDHTETGNMCVKCEAGRCNKECPGIVIDSLASAQKLLGCTHINGSLEIQIRGGKHVVSKLNESLSMIEVIDGYLKIVRSYPLISLNFFKTLHHIRGNVLEDNKYVIFVLDNQNLQELWTNRTMRIDQGKLFFHFNPRLCLEKILTLQRQANLIDYSELDVASNSNGDMISCHITSLKVTAEPFEDYIRLTWKPFEMTDHRSLLNYVVYSIETKHQNITMFDGRDACGGRWRVEAEDVKDGLVTHLLVQLKPFTQYAFYVETYTVASTNSGATSAIQYVSTLPSKPTQPLELKIALTSNSMHITWKPPHSANGKISHYSVSVDEIKVPLEVQMLDFCNAKINPVLRTQPTTMAPRRVVDNKTCVCDADIEGQSKDFLLNFVYTKRQPRSICNNPKYTVNHHLVRRSNHPKSRLSSLLRYDKIVNDTAHMVENLVNYKEYIIFVRVCRFGSEVENKDMKCSNPAIAIERTLMRDNADLISDLEITNVTSDSAMINWVDPKKPNGYIKSYHIKYRNLDDNDPQHQKRCISRKNVTSHRSYKLSGLKPGNWSVQMSVTSEAGAGRYTQIIYFYVRQSNDAINIVIGLLVAIILLIFGGFTFLRGYIRKDDMKLFKTINPGYSRTTYVLDDWEVPRDNIKQLNELGQGNFGMVYEGTACIKGRLHVRCAIKTVNKHATNRERMEFLNEASVMKGLETMHVVRLLGVVSLGQPTLVIMEFMSYGDLKTYLRLRRPDSHTAANDCIDRHPPNLRQILRMAIEIADGMAYLSAKKFVHRDVAARNCMVSENLVVKIGDFGLTRDVYETVYYKKSSKGLLPVRWMAPESLKDGVFTSSSDVWSYGVVLWEMATLASRPYQGLTNEQAWHYITGGNVMERPEQCPEILYDLMMRCWSHKPGDRPTFVELCDILLSHARPGFDMVSFYHSPGGFEARNQRSSKSINSDNLDDAMVPLRFEEQTNDEFEPALVVYHVGSMKKISALNGTNCGL